MTNQIVALHIDDVEVRQDAEGRYCLNDLHRAAGGAEKDKPVHFLKLQSTADLVAALKGENLTSDRINDLDPVRTVRSFTEEQGTFVVKELVYAYAMWISPAFHLKVIRTFDAAQRPQPVPMLPAQIGQITVQCMLDVAALCGVPRHYAIQVAAGEATRQTDMPWDRLLTQAAVMNDVPEESVMLEPTELGKLFDLSAVQMNRWLAQRGLQARVGGEWVPTKDGQPMCVRHAWVRGNKSGYNLKWCAASIEAMFNAQEAA